MHFVFFLSILDFISKHFHYSMIERALELTTHSEIWDNFFYFSVKRGLNFAYQLGHNLLNKSVVSDWIWIHVTILDHTHLPSFKIVLKCIIFHNFLYWFRTFLDSNSESCLPNLHSSCYCYIIYKTYKLEKRQWLRERATTNNSSGNKVYFHVLS